ncbi:MAG: hypothetical protein ABSB71_08900 [Candidatus Bathyarchaeia archaeon]
MSSPQELMDLLNHRIVSIDTSLDLAKSKPVVILEKAEIAKLLKQFEIRNETWIALKFNDSIFIIWRELVFLYLENPSDNKLQNK